MALTVEATYENGVLKPVQPLPLQEHEKVQVIVKPAVSHVRRTAGLMGWSGSQEAADFVALSPELDPQEHAWSMPTCRAARPNKPLEGRR